MNKYPNQDLIHFILDSLTPHYSALIWLTREPLSLYRAEGQSLNYLSNGLLGASFSHQQQQQTKNHESLYLTKNYGRPFVIIHKLISTPLSVALKSPEILHSLISQNCEETHSTAATSKVALLAPNNFKDLNYLYQQFAQIPLEQWGLVPLEFSASQISR